MVANEDFKKTWDWATGVARSIVDQYQNASDSPYPTLDVMIADALVNARAEGWQSAFDAWIGSDIQDVTALRAENADLKARLERIQSLYAQAAQTIRNQSETIRRGSRETRGFVGID